MFTVNKIEYINRITKIIFKILFTWSNQHEIKRVLFK